MLLPQMRYDPDVSTRLSSYAALRAANRPVVCTIPRPPLRLRSTLPALPPRTACYHWQVRFGALFHVAAWEPRLKKTLRRFL